MSHAGPQLPLDDLAPNPAANYQRFFVPVIGGPVADELVAAAALERGERVLDVACGTGAVTRRAHARVGDGGSVTGLDPNPAMLGVAREVTPTDAGLAWIQAPAEHIPLPDAEFDAVLCGMGLQFFEDREAGLREIHRVLKPGGRAVFSLPGPMPPMFAAFERALATHVSPEVAGFAAAVFSLYDADDIRELVRGAGFETVDLDRATISLRLPPPERFVWHYVYSTPLAAAFAGLDADRSSAFAREVVSAWADHARSGSIHLELGMTQVVAT